MLCKLNEGVDGDILLASFDCTNVGSVQANLVG